MTTDVKTFLENIKQNERFNLHFYNYGVLSEKIKCRFTKFETMSDSAYIITYTDVATSKVEVFCITLEYCTIESDHDLTIVFNNTRIDLEVTG